MQRFLPMISTKGSSRPKNRSCLRFKYSSVHELKAADKLPVHELSAVNDHSLRFKYSATPAVYLQVGRSRRSQKVTRVALDRVMVKRNFVDRAPQHKSGGSQYSPPAKNEQEKIQ
jgi:hypothetical protein